MKPAASPVWNLLRGEPCRACGRPAAEGTPCPWCGERAPIALASRNEAVPALCGVLCCFLAAAIGGLPTGPRDRPFLIALAALCGAAAAMTVRDAPAARGSPARRPVLAALALAAGLLALAAKLAAPAWRGLAEALAGAAWALPLAILAALLLRPAPLPPVPAATLRGRLAQRFGPPLLVAGLPLALCAAAFALAGEATPLGVLGFAAVLWPLGLRLRRPAPLGAAMVALLSPLVADPAAFALGFVLAAALDGPRAGETA